MCITTIVVKQASTMWQPETDNSPCLTSPFTYLSYISQNAHNATSNYLPTGSRLRCNFVPFSKNHAAKNEKERVASSVNASLGGTFSFCFRMASKSSALCVSVNCFIETTNTYLARRQPLCRCAFLVGLAKGLVFDTVITKQMENVLKIHYNPAASTPLQPISF